MLRSRKDNTEISQREVLSSLLWILVVNDLLKLEQRGCRFIAYADDFVLVFKGKYLNTVYELTEGYLNVVSNWTIRSGITVNPNKTKIIIFTRRSKIPNVPLPFFGGSRFQPVDWVKYLGLILDRKLAWMTNIEEKELGRRRLLYIAAAKL